MQDLIILQSSVPLRPQLEHSVQFWAMHSKNNFNSWDGVEMNSTRTITYVENMTYKERLKEWGLASSEKEDWGKMHLLKGSAQKAMINSSLYPHELQQVIA